MTAPVDPRQWRIGLVGYGEVGRILAEDLRAGGVARVAACDVKLGGSAEQPLREHAARHGVELVASHAALAGGADLVVSAVTASQTVPAAEAALVGRRHRRAPGLGRRPRRARRARRRSRGRWRRLARPCRSDPAYSGWLAIDLVHTQR